MRTEELSAALQSLCQYKRLQILEEIATGPDGGLIPSMLSSHLEIPSSTLSFHLSHLVRSGVLKLTKHAKYRVYEIDKIYLSKVIEKLSTLLGIEEEKENKNG